MKATSDFSHPVLLLIDLQEGFFESGPLAAARGQLAANCNQLVAAARAARIEVINVRTVHKQDRSTWTLKMLEDEQGYLFEGTGQAQNLAELDLAGSIEIIKHRDSAFWNTELLTQLLRCRASSIALAGVSSETCISATAADAFSANLPVALATDAVASADPDFDSTTLDFMRSQHRQKLLSANELCAVFAVAGPSTTTPDAKD